VQRVRADTDADDLDDALAAAQASAIHAVPAANAPPGARSRRPARVLRYSARPALAQERLALDDDGRVTPPRHPDSTAQGEVVRCRSTRPRLANWAITIAAASKRDRPVLKAVLRLDSDLTGKALADLGATSLGSSRDEAIDLGIAP
jgi:hypothetical protein